MVEKAVDIKTKVSLQLPSEIKKIDSRYPKGYRPSAKKNKDEATWKCQDRIKTKSHNPSPANSQPQTQASKKDKRHQKNRWGGYPAIGVNIIKVAKKDKDKTKDLSYIKCYTYKQKGYYANKCSKKPKKPVAVLANFTSMIEKKTEEELE